MTIQELIKLAKGKAAKPDHPNIVKNGKIHFWSLTNKDYIQSACQPNKSKR